MAELSFCELRTKQVINVIDGKALGRIVDIVFGNETSKCLGFVVPGDKYFKIFCRKDDIFIPFKNVIRIGIDVVLVELNPDNCFKSPQLSLPN
ncbi:MAG: YlmC/YmxH family sporulation protein [Christensenellaceae bacterium]|jgi:YlmC/YmxH family sporulation protein|nr:YlmC/YmxH family sporulation protein [Christensenellaceae bacterium]